MIQNKVAALRAMKKESGITKADLARRIGVSRSYITRLEAGELTPSLERAFDLARYLDCQIEDLFLYSKE